MQPDLAAQNVSAHGIIHNELFVVLGVEIRQMLCAHLLHSCGIGFDAKVIHLRPAELQTQQKEGYLSQRRFHPCTIDKEKGVSESNLDSTFHS